MTLETATHTSQKERRSRQRRSTRNGLSRVLPIGLAVLLGAGCLAAERAIHGSGRLNRVARAAYASAKGKARQWRADRAAAAAGVALRPLPPPERAEAPLFLYDAGLASGWEDWSWAERDLNDAAVSRRSGGKSLRMTAADWKGVFLHHSPLGAAGYGSVEVWVHGQQGRLTLAAADAGGKPGMQVALEAASPFAHIERNGWVRYRVPLTDLGVSLPGGTLSGIVVQEGAGKPQGVIHLDGIALLPDETLPAAPTTATVAVSVDATAPDTAISPYIYGMSFAPADYLSDLKLTVNRWGGNDKSRYNWKLGNACNAARDWNFANRVAVTDSSLPNAPSSAADAFVRGNRTAAAQTLLTIPTLGWVAEDTDNNHRSEGVPPNGDAPSTPEGSVGAIAGYDPSRNRAVTSVRSVAREADAQHGEVAQDAWVRHLTRTFGAASASGVRFYAMDNEPDLWDHTHTDVHPARMGYDDILSTFSQYASAVKDADPSAQITGPVSWGWTGYLYSPLDRGNDNFHSAADRKAHGGDPFLLWFLKSVRAKDAQTGRRTLDVMDVHFYPQGQGIYGPAADDATRALRLRSVDALWDSSYSDESWIGEPVRLIPRLKEWIAAGYPGTKIGLTEWNFGADADISGGLATAEALGIFGRDGVYLANYWAYPGKNTPAYLAFKLMRNADGQGHGFGDRALPVKTEDNDRLACFAAKDAKTGELTLLLLNKMRKATITAPVTLSGISNTSPMEATRYSFSAAAPGSIATADGLKVAAGKLTIALPPYSATLVRIPKASGGAAR